MVKRFIKSIDKGLLKVMSKMGISTYQSYCGAQIFDAVGLSKAFVDKFFFGTATMIEGVGLDGDRRGDGAPPRDAFGDSPVLRGALEVGGEYAYRAARRGAQLDAADGLVAAARGARQRPRQVSTPTPSCSTISPSSC